MNKIFRYQLWHLLSLISLLLALDSFIDTNPGSINEQLWGVRTLQWFWLAVSIPILHQTYVWLIWRMELYKQSFSSIFGVQRAFKLYTYGFSLLFSSRLIFICILAVSNQNSLKVEPYINYMIAAIISPLIIYLFYSVIKYFTLERAYGIDHFDKSFNKPYVKQGIFRYVDNAMYICGFMILYLPGLLLFSKSALIVALFNHLYIWVHYYCTERPDMQEIYGKIPGES